MQRQIEAAARAIAAVWENHGDGYLSAGLFEEMARAVLQTKGDAMDLDLKEMTTIIRALDRYIADTKDPDILTAISVHNNLLDLVKKDYSNADILKPYHDHL